MEGEIAGEREREKIGREMQSGDSFIFCSPTPATHTTYQKMTVAGVGPG